MKGVSVLLVDDDRHLLQSMGEWLSSQGHTVETAATSAEAQKCLDRKRFDVALIDVNLRDGDGFELLARCRELAPETAVVMISGYATVDSAVEAIRAGAFDFLTKPLIDEELALSIERAVGQRQVLRENKQLRAQLDLRYGIENVIGRDHRMQRVFDLIESVADTKATVLITGESGTGKSLIARAIHRLSSRRSQPLIEVACGALPETLLESELFGHVSGAFTGANVDRQGKFVAAQGGTIFLDEIGTAPPSLQVKLLRVLQDFEVEPVGGNKTIKVDVRVILATNEDLSQLVAQGRFRQDLYYRINVIHLELPSLRERISDIPLLARHFLEQACEETGKRVADFTPEALEALQRYRWPGNIRELQNVVERAVLLGKREVVGLEDLSPDVLAMAPLTVDSLHSKSLKQALADPERRIILDMLESNHWNRHATALALGINRTTLYKKMKRLGLEFKRPGTPIGG